MTAVDPGFIDCKKERYNELHQLLDKRIIIRRVVKIPDQPPAMEIALSNRPIQSAKSRTTTQTVSSIHTIPEKALMTDLSAKDLAKVRASRYAGPATSKPSKRTELANSLINESSKAAKPEGWSDAKRARNGQVASQRVDTHSPISDKGDNSMESEISWEKITVINHRHNVFTLHRGYSGHNQSMNSSMS